MYIRAHPRSKPDLDTVSTVSQLHTLTDGIPALLDIALKNLDIMSLSELLARNSDVVGSNHEVQNISSPLLQAIVELSENQKLVREYELLKALVVFPGGERLDRIKRFNGATGFFPPQVLDLVDRALVDALPIINIGVTAGEAPKNLVVRRAAREYIRQLIGDDNFSRLNNLAISIYFGEGWENGKFKNPPGLRFDDAKREPEEIVNANTIILRLLGSVFESPDTRKIRQALNLATFYSAALRTGDHFRGVSSFVQDLLKFIPAVGFEKELFFFRSTLANCLRLICLQKKSYKI
jgi:hypothetical protein